MAAQERLLPDLETLPRPFYSRRESLVVDTWTPPHTHPWGQFSYASRGVLGVRTSAGDFTAPPRYGVWLPPGEGHQVLSHGPTEMRSFYLTPEAARQLSPTCQVLEVTPLARELIRAAGELPVDYDEAGPAGRLVAVLLDQLAALPQAAFTLPMPRDPRLVMLCRALEEAPDDRRPLTAWAAQVGASERTLARRFRQETGMSFREWRQGLRLNLSLAALERGKASPPSPYPTATTPPPPSSPPSAYASAPPRGVWGVRGKEIGAVFSALTPPRTPCFAEASGNR